MLGIGLVELLILGGLLLVLLVGVVFGFGILAKGFSIPRPGHAKLSCPHCGKETPAQKEQCQHCGRALS